MSFFQNISRSDIHTRSKRIDIYKRICAVIFIGCSILMPVILDLVMPYNIVRDMLIREASINDKISASQVIGIIIDSFNNFSDENISVYVIAYLIFTVVIQIAVVVISFIGAKKSKICLYILMVGYAFGILFYIFFPLAGMDFSSLNTTFPVINKMVTIPGEISKYLLFDLLLRIIALIALYMFRRVKYDGYEAD